MFKIGDIVIFVDYELHEETPQFYPPVGTRGKVKDVITPLNEVLVQWFEKTTFGNHTWWCGVENLIYDKGQNDYTDNEVWNFLKPKMSQYANYDINNLSQEIKNMIVSAYRSGYGRAFKNRPFKIGDKK